MVTKMPTYRVTFYLQNIRVAINKHALGITQIIKWIKDTFHIEEKDIISIEEFF